MKKYNEYNDYSKAVIKAKMIIGNYEDVGNLCGVSGVAVRRWIYNGRPPRTEYTGQTNYANIIAAACNGQITKEQLLPNYGQLLPRPIKDRRKIGERRTENLLSNLEEATE